MTMKNPDDFAASITGKKVPIFVAKKELEDYYAKGLIPRDHDGYCPNIPASGDRTAPARMKFGEEDLIKYYENAWKYRADAEGGEEAQTPPPAPKSAPAPPEDEGEDEDRPKPAARASSKTKPASSSPKSSKPEPSGASGADYDTVLAAVRQGNESVIGALSDLIPADLESTLSRLEEKVDTVTFSVDRLELGQAQIKSGVGLLGQAVGFDEDTMKSYMSMSLDELVEAGYGEEPDPS